MHFHFKKQTIWILRSVNSTTLLNKCTKKLKIKKFTWLYCKKNQFKICWFRMRFNFPKVYACQRLHTKLNITCIEWLPKVEDSSNWPWEAEKEPPYIHHKRPKIINITLLVARITNPNKINTRLHSIVNITWLELIPMATRGSDRPSGV